MRPHFFVDDLARNGCAALGNRLTGPVPISRMCVKHLRGTIRVVVAFGSPRRACIVLIGPHDDTHPNRDVCAELYELPGAAPFEGAADVSRHAAAKTASRALGSATISPI